jgi:hypothetical protein
VALPVLFVEGKGGAESLGRSFNLVQGRWWATFARLAVSYILVFFVVLVAGGLVDAVATGLLSDTSTGALILDRVGDFLVTIFTTPFIAAATTLVYFDLRVRKEGFDLTLLADRMGGGGADAGTRPPQPRDAFGNPVAPSSVPPPSASVPPPAPRPAAPPPPSEPGATPGGGWAPPVPPEPPRRDE